RVPAQRGLFLPNRDGKSGRDRPLLERDRRQWRPGERVRLVQGPLGSFLADYSTRTNGRVSGRGWRSPGGPRRHDGDEEDRRRHNRGGAARLTLTVLCSIDLARVAITGLNKAALDAARKELGDVIVIESDAGDAASQGKVAEEIRRAFG